MWAMDAGVAAVRFGFATAAPTLDMSNSKITSSSSFIRSEPAPCIVGIIKRLIQQIATTATWQIDIRYEAAL
jgi:hypothetical protein